MAGKSIRAHGVASEPRVRRPASPSSLKSLKSSLLATAAVCAVMVFAAPASAQSPTGGNVVAGTAGIAQSGLVTNINQSSQKAIINWQGFSVGAQNTVNFNQPSSSSATLNRVIGNEQSVIDGAINANGQVFIVNSAGVLFGKGSQVNVGGLVASTLDISNNDFMAGNYKFSGTSNASVVNQGRIRARGDGQGGGYVALLGKTVSNEGVIAAKLGTVAMASGEKITLNFGGDSLIDVTIDKGTLNALVQNKRAIIANGGTVILTAKAADQVLSAQVNNTGIIQARTMAALKGGSNGGTVKIGKIKLLALGGTTNVSGKLDASAPKGGDGGFIETSGDYVKIADSAVITTLAPYGVTGTWLIDPIDFTIAASGGDISGAALSTLLNTTSQIFSATNNLYVNDVVSWSANTTLTLTAGNDLYVNKAITASGDTAALNLTATAGTIYINNAITLSGAHTALAMTYGTGYDIRTEASYVGVADEPGPVYDTDGNLVDQLVAVQKVNPPLAYPSGTKASYGAPAPGSPVYDADGNPVMEFVRGNQAIGPVARQDTSGGVYGSISFANGSNKNGLVINGVTYTLVHSMSDLVGINSATPDVNGYTSGNGNYALAGNLYATSDGTASGAPTSYSNAVITSLDGTLAGLGHTISSLTINASSTNNIGLIGQITAPNATIRDIGLIGAHITGQNNVGALLGSYASTGLTISQAYSTGAIVGANYVGGLIGSLGTEPANATNVKSATPSVIRNSYSNASVSGAYSGGLIGNASGATVSHTYATGSVTGALDLGGLIGRMQFTTVDTSYATGEVKGVGGQSNTIGGLIGFIHQYQRPGAKSSVANSFATGAVSGEFVLGGLIGAASGLTRSDNTRAGFDQFFTTVANSYAIGNVTLNDASNVGGVDLNQGVIGSGVLDTGGLIGGAASVIITDTFATGDVVSNAITGTAAGLGGLVGRMYSRDTTVSSGSITRSFATGNVRGAILFDSNGVQYYNVIEIGGLVGTAGITPIVDSYATGNVAGFNTVGGLVGSGGLVTDSFAAGNVTGALAIGGLVGSALDITRSFSVGDVTGISFTNKNGTFVNSAVIGGLAGILYGLEGFGHITDSWASGAVSGLGQVGGLVGRSDFSSVITNSYWNGSSGSVGIGDRSSATVVNGGGALTGDQVKDAQFYANGTIDQVLADRAAAAAAKAARLERAAEAAAAQQAQAEQGARTASVTASNAQVSSVTPPDPAAAKAGEQATQSPESKAIEESVKSVDDAVKAADTLATQERERQERQRRAAAQQRGDGRAGSGGNFGATIRLIDVDGQRFNLQDGAPKQDAPAQAPQ